MGFGNDEGVIRWIAPFVSEPSIRLKILMINC